MTLDEIVARVTDPYERPARLYPALLALLPLLSLLLLHYGPKATAMTAAVTLAVSCGGLYLTTNLCRELGKRLEEKLYKGWGGKPTTQLLRHRDKTIEGVTKRRYHSFLAVKIKETFPDKNQEAKNPEAADEVYQSGVRWLLNHTRPADSDKFELLSKENVTYGFRRNALAMKPVGLTISIGSILWILASENVLLVSGRRLIDLGTLWRLPDTASASLLLSAAMVMAWVFFFTVTSVRTAAFTYAETLLRACDSL